MDIQFSYLITILSIIFFLFFSNSIFFRRSKPTRSLPPGPRKLPFIGNLHNLIGDLPHRALHQLALKHGPLMHLQLGELSAVVVSSPDAAKQVMKTHDINFASRPPILAAEITGYGCKSITFSPYGDYWRQLRRICTVELLSAKRVQSFRSVREEVFLDLARRVASMEGKSMDLTEIVSAATHVFAFTASLGKKTKKLEALLPIFKRIVELAAGFDIAELFPSIGFFRFISGSKRELIRLHREGDEILEQIINQHRSRANSDEKDDLLDVLLKIQEDRVEIPMDNDNIKAVMMDMLAAGSETSATVVDWAMAEMLKNPDVLAKVQEEVRRVFDDKGYVEESFIHELKYLKSVVKETLRLHPPLTLLLPRKCGETCEINGHEIPAETKIIVNAWAVNRDPNYWENGDRFEPERFMDSVVDYKGNHYEYIPFGAGRRMCPGISFGLANVELPLAMFLYHFNWKLADGIEPQEMDMAESFGVTARRNQNLCVVPIIVRPLPV